MTQTRILIMIAGGFGLALVLFASVMLSGGLNGSESDDTGTEVPPAASLTPVTFTRVSEAVSDDQLSLQISGLAEPSAVIVLLDRGNRIRQVRATPQGVWSARVDVTDPGMAIEAVLFMNSPGSQTQGPTDVPGTLESMTRIRGVETIFRLQQPTTVADVAEVSDVADEPVGPTRGLVMIATPGGPTRLVQSPFAALPQAGPLTLETIDYDDMGGVIFSGSSQESGRVRLYVADTAIGETRVGEDGRWTYIASSVMPMGDYAVRVELLDSPAAPIISVPFERLPPLPQSNSDDGSLAVSFTPSHWQVRRSLVGGGSQTTVIFAP